MLAGKFPSKNKNKYTWMDGEMLAIMACLFIICLTLFYQLRIYVIWKENVENEPTGYFVDAVLEFPYKVSTRLRKLCLDSRYVGSHSDLNTVSVLFFNSAPGLGLFFL
jgi:hypothetical protein